MQLVLNVKEKSEVLLVLN